MPQIILDHCKFVLQLCYKETLLNTLNIKNPINDLLSNFSDIEKFLQINNSERFKLLFFNMKKIHHILYFSEELIKLNNIGENINLNNLFYLNLLIMDDLSIINYIYSLNDIKVINNINNTNNNILKKLIISKIIINLIYNYKGIYSSDEETDKEELKKIENFNISLIKDNKDILKEFDIDLNEFEKISTKIDQIYSLIIISLLKNRKFEDFEYSYGIIRQLELDSIIITKYMFDELYNILSKDESYINDYKIRTIDDLFSINKLNFYFILLKYIFKNPFFIYNIPFLLETRKILIDIINNKLNLLLPFKINDVDTIKKNEFLFKFILDSLYYYKIQSYFKLNEIFLYYKEFCYESKKEDIKIIEKMIKNNRIEANINIENYLKDFDIAKNINIRKPIIKYLNNLKIKNKNIQEAEEELKKSIETWKSIEKMINEKKLKKIKKDLKIYLKNYFSDINNKKILIKIFRKEIYDYFKNNIKINNQNNNIEIENKNYKEEINEEKNIEKHLKIERSKSKDNQSTRKESKFIINLIQVNLKYR